MNFLIFFLLSFFPILISSHSHHKPCLTDVAATTLITKWFTLFTSADSSQFGALTSAVLTDDFTYEDETLNFAIGLCFVKAEGPIAPSRAIFVEILKARLADSGTVDEKHEALDTVRSCNKIAVRVQNSASTRGNIPNNTALAGESVRWKGIDILTVDVSNMKIEKAVSSSDWFRNAHDTGKAIVFQKHSFPTCLCQTPNPSFDKDENCVKPPVPT